MAPKEPNRHQLSSRLSYSQHTPSFLLKLQNRIAGIPDEEEEYDEEFEDDGSGRPPIPRRPAIPERPEDDPGSADEDDGDEKPQVVVLREGKHLTEREAENVKRKGMSIHLAFFTRTIQANSLAERGLPPLPEPTVKASEPDSVPSKEAATGAKTQPGSLSFSSSKTGPKSKATKRKAVGDTGEETDMKKNKNVPMKKPKKSSKRLLSFGDDT